jgi:osmotically-inducible protein OsmY
MSAVHHTVETVRAALSGEPRVDLVRHPVALAFEDGVLTLEGEVGSVAAKKLALERAAAVKGVRNIVDRLRVKPARRMTDAEIRDHVGAALQEEPALLRIALRLRAGKQSRELHEPDDAVGAIAVAVADGIVTLDGEVPSLAHKRLAGVLAWWVPGSRDVVNGLEVVPPEADNEGEISDAVLLALEKDPLVDADQIWVGTRGAVVTLGGVVPSEPQREVAEHDAWCVFGVDEVVNRIAVRA